MVKLAAQAVSGPTRGPTIVENRVQTQTGPHQTGPCYPSRGSEIISEPSQAEDPRVRGSPDAVASERFTTSVAPQAAQGSGIDSLVRGQCATPSKEYYSCRAADRLVRRVNGVQPLQPEDVVVKSCGEVCLWDHAGGRTGKPMFGPRTPVSQRHGTQYVKWRMAGPGESTIEDKPLPSDGPNRMWRRQMPHRCRTVKGELEKSVGTGHA